jgi:F-type H+-transporting ATPase subunit epsilon
MAGRIHLEIVTPEGLRLAADVDELTAPSVQGEFGVLPAHRPLLAGLRTGIVSYLVSGVATSVGIGPGFAKVADDRVSILTDHFVAKAAVDPVVARRDLKQAEQALGGLPADASLAEQERLIAAVRWAAVQLELYGDPPPATIIMAHEMRLLGHEDYSLPAQTEDGESDAVTDPAGG